MIQTDLIGKYAKFPYDGDAGWIRALFVSHNRLYVLVQRDNSSNDLKTYVATEMVLPREDR